MTEIDPYIRALLLVGLSDLKLKQGHRRKDEVLPELIDLVGTVLEANEVPLSITNVPEFSEEFFAELVEHSVIVEEDHRFAGLYYVYVPSRFVDYREKVLKSDNIVLNSRRVGSRYFHDVFDGYLRQRGVDDVEAAGRGAFTVPASDRVVTVGDNSNALIGEIEDLKISIRSHNDSDEKLVGRRDRIIGELAAGQELIRSGSFRLKAITTVLMGTLTFIAAEFAGGIIGDLAVKLLEQLKPLIGM